MKQLKLFDRFNSSPREVLEWLAGEQKAGRLYSRRELLRMPMETRSSAGTPRFSRSGLIRMLAELAESGKITLDQSIHRKIMVVGVALPVGSACFLR